MHVLDKDGKEKFTLIDRNTSGQWNMTIDEATGKVYMWKMAVGHNIRPHSVLISPA